jgi:hypothetical protein
VVAQADESGGAAWGNVDALANLWTAILYVPRDSTGNRKEGRVGKRTRQSAGHDVDTSCKSRMNIMEGRQADRSR